MGAADATAGDEIPVEARGQQAAQRDVVGLASWHPAQLRAAAARVVDVDRIRATGDGVGELPGSQDVLAGELLVADDPAGLAHTDLHAALGDVGLLEAGHAPTQEADELV